jgi:ABC-type microcin C transport system duplicated ATPase subunit YejF
MSILSDLVDAEVVLASHSSAIRKELNAEIPYTQADKDERSEICLLMIDRLSKYVEESEDITQLQLASVMSVINELLGLRRALTLACRDGNSGSYGKTKRSRDIMSLSVSSCRSLFLQEESSKLDTIPEYFS